MDCDCIISLTSWKGRIDNPDLPKVFFSIIRQKTKYKFKIVFVLSKIEFPNMEDDLPSLIVKIIKHYNIELIWTDDNLKAYKKLYPVMKKYPNLPIMTTDDDIILKEDCIETYMNEHIINPKLILCEVGHKLIDKNEIVTGTFRLYPPKSLLDIDSMYFKIWFKGMEDDVYNAILANLKGTMTKIMKSGKANEIYSKEYIRTAFRKEYMKLKPEIPRLNLIKALRKQGII